jgi:hypothetical protein
VREIELGQRVAELRPDVGQFEVATSRVLRAAELEPYAHRALAAADRRRKRKPFRQAPTSA